MMLVCCQEVDLTEYEQDSAGSTPAEMQGKPVTVYGTGEGTTERPYTVGDIRSMSLSRNDSVWVIGYLVGTARTAMSHAVFSIDADNQSNILLSNDSLCKDTAHCIPVELYSDKWRKNLSLPTNTAHFRKCLLVKGVPSVYLHRKGLRSVSAGLWLDGFDIASVVPQEWDSIELPF